MNPQKKCYSKILIAFDKSKNDNTIIENTNESSIPHILKFKLKSLYEMKQDVNPLIKLIAYMIQNDELEIEDILFQSDSVLQDYGDINSLEAAYSKGKVILIICCWIDQNLSRIDSRSKPLILIVLEKKKIIEHFYDNERVIKLSNDPVEKIQKDKERDRQELLKTYNHNFELCLLHEFAKINSWRDIEIITDFVSSYYSHKHENEHNFSMIDPKWHTGYCSTL